MTDTSGPTLDSVRGGLTRGRSNARAVAAITDNPGCTRRRVVEAVGVRAHDLADRAGFPATRGQSPFAITSGTMFEDQLKTRSRYRALADVLRPYVDLPDEGLRVEDLNRVGKQPDPQAWLDARVKRTDDVLTQLASSTDDAPHLVDHPMLTFELSGIPVYLEPDALAFRVGAELELVEIKSYPVIDDQADPSKVAATAGQSAVYLMALRTTLARLGFDPDLLRWSVILVAPKNFSRFPTAHRVPLRKKTMAIQRVLDAATPAADILATLPAGYSLDAGDDPAATAARLAQLDPLHVPECLSSCDLAAFCRHEAHDRDDPSRLGRHARDILGDTDRLHDALTIARGTDGPTAPEHTDVVEHLRAGYQALARARAATGLTVDTPTPGDAVPPAATPRRRTRGRARS